MCELFWTKSSVPPLCFMSRIDVHQDDRGLAACFAGAQLQDAWVQAYLKVHQVTTLDDFIYMVRASDWSNHWVILSPRSLS